MKMDTDAIVHRDTQEADVTKVSFQIWHIMTHYIMTYVIALKVSYWQAFNNFYFYLNKFLEETARVTWTFKYLYFENIFFFFLLFPRNIIMFSESLPERRTLHSIWILVHL